MQFATGTVVRLKSGGSTMVVEAPPALGATRSHTAVSAGVHCVWFENGRKRRASFSPGLLEEVKQER